MQAAPRGGLQRDPGGGGLQNGEPGGTAGEAEADGDGGGALYPAGVQEQKQYLLV